MNDKLLARTEKLEKAVQDIWASYSCLRKGLDDELPEDEIPELPEEEWAEKPKELEEPEWPGDIIEETEDHE